jgi:hypothetical protein
LMPEGSRPSLAAAAAAGGAAAAAAFAERMLATVRAILRCGEPPEDVTARMHTP